jgi:hypothetical protein
VSRSVGKLRAKLVASAFAAWLDRVKESGMERRVASRDDMEVSHGGK